MSHIDFGFSINPGYKLVTYLYLNSCCCFYYQQLSKDCLYLLTCSCIFTFLPINMVFSTQVLVSFPSFHASLCHGHPIIPIICPITENVDEPLSLTTPFHSLIAQNSQATLHLTTPDLCAMVSTFQGLNPMNCSKKQRPRHCCSAPGI